MNKKTGQSFIKRKKVDLKRNGNEWVGAKDLENGYTILSMLYIPKYNGFKLFTRNQYFQYWVARSKAVIL